MYKQILKFLFLLYVPRSGSTVIARHLAEISEDILVTPEFRLPGLLLMHPEEKIRSYNCDELLEIFYLDYQLDNLGLSKKSVKLIAESNVGKGTYEIINAFVTHHAKKKEIQPKLVIIKNGNLLYLQHELTKRFYGCSFIHIVRDCRGVTNSLLTARNLHDKRTMGRNDIVYCAKLWESYLDKAANLKKAGSHVDTLQFEQFLSDPEESINILIDHLCLYFGIELNRNGSRNTFSIPYLEKSLHKLVYAKPQDTRGTAWRHELKLWQGVVIEKIAEKNLQLYDYQPCFTKNRTLFTQQKFLLYAYLIHIGLQCLHNLRRLFSVIKLLVCNRKLAFVKFRLLLYRDYFNK